MKLSTALYTVRDPAREDAGYTSRMADQVHIDGNEYISSKRASQLSGYTQDYIGQLARSGQIDAKRVGGLWYISSPSLDTYKREADAYVPQPPQVSVPAVAESVISFDGRDYVSASRAADLTGYHQDYVGQLARSGTILARQVGNRWYVDREGLLEHKREKDALLAAVQSQAVGFHQGMPQEPRSRAASDEIHFTYTRDDGAILPAITQKTKDPVQEEVPVEGAAQQIPIRVRPAVVRHYDAPILRPVAREYQGNKAYFSKYVHLAGAALTIVIVLTFGIATWHKYETFAVRAGNFPTAMAAGAASTVDTVGNVLETLLSPELEYKAAN